MAVGSKSDWPGLVLTLHRYLCWATKLRERFKEPARVHDETVRAERQQAGIDLATVDPDALAYLDLVQLVSSDFGLYLFHYYGSLYVVVEGYQDLKLADPIADQLLTSPFVDALRLARNGTFHFQSDYFSPKQLDQDEFVDWVLALHDALSNYLSRELQAAAGNYMGHV